MESKKRTMGYDGSFPIDSALPQLGIAWNAELMLAIFRKRLKPVKEDRFEILKCEIERFRYRQGIRSIIHYVLLLRDTATKIERKLWVTGIIYSSDKSRHLYEQALASDAWRNIPESLLALEPACYIPDLKMFVQAFPFDRSLPSLPALLAGPPPELKTLLIKQFGPGDWSMESCGIDPVRYHPLLSITLRYNIAARNRLTDKREMRTFYIKSYSDDRGREAYALLDNLYRCFSSGEKGFSTVKPIGYLENFRSLILEGAHGKSLEQIIIDGKNVNKAISKTARALAELHQSKLTFPATRHRPAEGTYARVKKAGKFIQWAYPVLNEKVEKIMDRLKRGLTDVSPCPTHLDIKTDHIFIDGDNLVFIDLDSFSLSDPVFDPASLLVRMEMLPNLSSIPQSTVNSISQLFLKEYFSHVQSDWRGRISVNYICAAFKVALYYIQHQEPHCYKKVVSILDRCSELLPDNIRASPKTGILRVNLGKSRPLESSMSM